MKILSEPLNFKFDAMIVFRSFFSDKISRTAKLLVVLVALVSVSGCRVRFMNFNIPVPPIQPVPMEIERVLLVDRTAAVDKQGELIEGILTGEGFGQDVRNRQECLMGAAAQLRNSGRFVVVRAEEVLEGGKRGEVLANPMPFEKVKALCEKYETDAILAMESYDSDFIITPGVRTSGGFSFSAEGVAKVNIAFRLYDGKFNEILDENTFNHTMRWNKGGNSVQDAIAALLNKQEAIRRISNEGGALYAQRFSPSVFRARREYFNRGHQEVQFGARLMEANDWDRAIEVLEGVVNDPSYKMRDRGFAAHNLAVIYEVLSDIPKAKEWAGRAWSEFQNRPSRDYVYVLNRRN